jgi:hypothetical protein
MDTLTAGVCEDKDLMTQLMRDFFFIIPGMDKASSVPVLHVESLSKDIFESNWVSKNSPCLIKGAVRHWPAMERWKEKQYWISSCRNNEVSIYPHQNFISSKRQESGQEKLAFHSAMERLFENRDYIFSMPGKQIMKGSDFEKLEEDIPGFTFLPSPEMPRWYERMRFFAYRRAATNWHYHGVDETLMCQIKGSKKVGLLPPCIPQIKHVTNFLQEERYLEGQVLDPSLQLNPYTVDVEEGDALYIPPYWHHVVVPNDGEMGFTLAYCWRSPLHILGNFSNYLLRTVYRQGMWPFNPKTLLLPFLGCYAAFLYYTKKIAGKI